MSLVNFKKGTLENYKEINSPSENTLYFVTDKGLLYLGSKLIAATKCAQKIVSNEPVTGVYIITYIDSNNNEQSIEITTSSQTSALITNAIELLDVNKVELVKETNSIVTINNIKEVDGKIALNTDGAVSLGDAAKKTAFSGDIPTSGTVSSTDLVNAKQVADYVAEKMSGVVGAMVYQGTIGDSTATIQTLPAASALNKGFVYVVKTAGTYADKACEPGDMIISNGTSWDVINGENQVTDSAATITPGATSSTKIATVDGTDITLKVSTLTVEDAAGTSGNVISELSTATAGKLTVTKTNVISSITGETAISGGNSNYVAVTATTSSNATTLASSVKTQTLSSATSSADGLATAYDIKQNAANKCVMTSYSTVTGGTIATTDTINGAVNKLETALVWGTF